MLRATPNSGFQCRIIQDLQLLEGEIRNPNAALLSANLKKFSANLESTDVRHLTSFHAVTTVFEFFALYLMFRVCRTGLVVPQSWIDVHISRLVGIRRSLFSEALPEDSIYIYRRCLIDLTRNFSRIVSKLDPSASPETMKGFRLGIRTYPSRLLHRRNVELLSVAIINLWATGIDLPNVTGAWIGVCKVNKIKLSRLELRGLPFTRP